MGRYAEGLLANIIFLFCKYLKEDNISITEVNFYEENS